MNSKIPCSVEILTLNSEKTLPECLESVKDFSDVYIVDGNSTDKTQDIARSFGASVYSQFDSSEPDQRITNFGEARKRAESFAKNDWLLYLDSDEYLSPELVQEIRNIFSVPVSEKNAYLMPYRLVIEGKVILHSFTTPRYIRLYNRKGGITWKKKVVHEKMDIPSDVSRVHLTNFFYGHVPAYASRIGKDKHYLGLMKKKLLAKGQASQPLLALASMFKNMLRAFNIFIKSVLIYIRYGFRDSIPPLEVWRYVRYHLVIAYYRFRQSLISIF